MTGSGQKASGLSAMLVFHGTQLTAPPADRQALTCFVKAVEHGKPDNRKVSR